MPHLVTRGQTALVGRLERSVDLRKGAVWIRLATEVAELVSVLAYSVTFPLRRGVRLVCIGSWGKSDNRDKTFLAEELSVARRIVEWGASAPKGSYFGARDERIDHQVKRDLAVLLGETEDPADGS